MNRKIKSRIAVTLAVVLSCIVIGIILYAQLNLKEKSQRANLFQLVPSDAQTIIETNNINSLFQALETTSFQKDYEQLHISDLFDFLNHKIDDLAAEKGHGLSVPMSNVLISFHAPGKSKDQVIYGHLGNGDKNLMESILKELNTTGYKPKEFKYKGKKIIIYPINNQEFLACFFESNCYAISFQKKLIESVIDAYVNNKSILSDSLFSQIYQKKKSENNLRLYAHSTPIAKWNMYDTHIQGNSIYLTGFCHRKNGKGSDYFPILSDAEAPILPADFMPKRTQIFYQLGIQNIREFVNTLAYNDSIFHNAPKAESQEIHKFYKFIEDYAYTEFDNIEFRGADMTQSHRIMLIPLKFESSSTWEAWKQVGKRLWKSVYHKGHAYPLYTFSNNRMLKYLLSERAAQKNDLMAIINEQYLIISDEEKDIKAYLNSNNYSERNKEFWHEYLSDLAPKANFTFFADMEDIYRRTTEFNNMFPAFFFKHLDFFRKFNITVQFIESGEILNTNIILNYKEPNE